MSPKKDDKMVALTLQTRHVSRCCVFFKVLNFLHLAEAACPVQGCKGQPHTHVRTHTFEMLRADHCCLQLTGPCPYRLFHRSHCV